MIFITPLSNVTVSPPKPKVLLPLCKLLTNIFWLLIMLQSFASTDVIFFLASDIQKHNHFLFLGY